ncbi:MAG: hypothetical protein HN411_02350 [Waddliaceae bacterium]|jgi:hypothetical protein|nr:hypothetical protein [Waddliaceae bacterium]MBT3578747.1 hypothetical protein [Waddliaceae bacterium]MBT4444351.1 hypothetical protein [Waddliaceae bacterium]MBT6929092.1 hypothetical protein [Waddliaceae bacterium]MBT7264378.1 hypothetical protein [Waddliaceae bacterium]
MQSFPNISFELEYPNATLQHACVGCCNTANVNVGDRAHVDGTVEFQMISQSSTYGAEEDQPRDAEAVTKKLREAIKQKLDGNKERFGNFQVACGVDFGSCLNRRVSRCGRRGMSRKEFDRVERFDTHYDGGSVNSRICFLANKIIRLRKTFDGINKISATTLHEKIFKNSEEVKKLLSSREIKVLLKEVGVEKMGAIAQRDDTSILSAGQIRDLFNVTTKVYRRERDFYEAKVPVRAFGDTVKQSVKEAFGKGIAELTTKKIAVDDDETVRRQKFSSIVGLAEKTLENYLYYLFWGIKRCAFDSMAKVTIEQRITDSEEEYIEGFEFPVALISEIIESFSMEQLRTIHDRDFAWKNLTRVLFEKLMHIAKKLPEILPDYVQEQVTEGSRESIFMTPIDFFATAMEKAPPPAPEVVKKAKSVMSFLECCSCMDGAKESIRQRFRRTEWIRPLAYPPAKQDERYSPDRRYTDIIWEKIDDWTDEKVCHGDVAPDECAGIAAEINRIFMTKSAYEHYPRREMREDQLPSDIDKHVELFRIKHA